MEPESTAASTEIAPQNPIRVETALSRYPVHRLARKGSIDIHVKEGTRPGDGMSWEVDYSKKHGQPGPLAYKLDTLIINRRIEEARRPIPRILRLGSLSDICRELNLADSGKNRSDIKNSLFQNAFAGITAKTRYRRTDGSETTLEAAFNRYSVILTGEKLPDGTKADAVYIVLNDVFIRVINGAMTRPLDYDYLKSLAPASQRFYELLSYQMYFALKYDRMRAKLTYSDFCAHAPLLRHTEWNRVRSQMGKVHRPHLQSGYIGKIESEPTTDSEGKPDWIFFYQPGIKARTEYKAFTKRGGPIVVEIEPLQLEPPEVAEPPVSELEAELCRRGITGAIASDLVAQYPEERIRAQIERVDYLVESKPEKVEDRAAYLVMAIKNDYAAPQGYVSPADREKKAERKAAQARKQAEERRRRQEADERRKQADAFIKTLGVAERSELEAKALEAASPGARENYHAPALAKFRDTLMAGILRDYVEAHRLADA